MCHLWLLPITNFTPGCGEVLVYGRIYRTPPCHDRNLNLQPCMCDSSLLSTQPPYFDFCFCKVSTFSLQKHFRNNTTYHIFRCHTVGQLCKCLRWCLSQSLTFNVKIFDINIMLQINGSKQQYTYL